MAHNVDTRAETPANELRTLLDQAERQLPSLARPEVEAYLRRLDQLEILFETLPAEGLDLRAEQARWDDLLRRIDARAASLLRTAGGASQWAELRRRHPASASFWWRLDEQVAAARRRQLQRFAIGAVAVLLLLAGAGLIYQRFFAPSPEVSLWLESLSTVERSVMAQDWTTAIQAADNALLTLPDDIDLLLWRAVLAERTGDAAAQAAFLERARAVQPDPLSFSVLLGMKQLQAGDLAGAAATAEEAQRLDPTLAEAVFILASVAEASGDRAQALELFERAAALADEGKPELAVTSRMRLATLLQQGVFDPEPPATETAP